MCRYQQNPLLSKIWVYERSHSTNLHISKMFGKFGWITSRTKPLVVFFPWNDVALWRICTSEPVYSTSLKEQTTSVRSFSKTCFSRRECWTLFQIFEVAATCCILLQRSEHSKKNVLKTQWDKLWIYMNLHPPTWATKKKTNPPTFHWVILVR